MSAQQEIRIAHRSEGWGSPWNVTLTASVGDEYSGRLIYHRSVGSECWELEGLDFIEGLDIREEAQIIETEKALLQFFAERVGAGQLVRAVIFQDHTGMLAQKYMKAGVEGGYSVPKGEFSGIPFVKILDSGNIDVETITVAPPNPLNPKVPYEIELWGRTR